LKITKERIQRMDTNYSDGWYQLQLEGLIEYLDVEEEESTMIAMFPHYINNYPSEHVMYTRMVEIMAESMEGKTIEETVVKKVPRYTHCEIHPATILGIAAHSIPFAHHNPSPRNTYQCAMTKQAIGIFATNYDQRTDTMMHSLWYPQRELVSTKGLDSIGAKNLPSGINAIVAICCYGGYNQVCHFFNCVNILLNYMNILLNYMFCSYCL
jgi:DNA-directed RNA polymerase II subunit RPB2